MTKSPASSRVRQAVASDVPVLRELFHRFWEENFPTVAYNPKHFLSYVEKNLGNDDLFIAILNEKDGVIMGCVTPTVYSPEPMAREMVWYTLPEARGHGMLLYRAFESWAKASHVSQVMFTLPWVEPKMERLGYKMAEVSYFKRLGPDLYRD